MPDSHGLDWAQAQYDRQTGPNPFTDEWGFTDEEDDNGES
jgi:hypothetical protein